MNSLTEENYLKAIYHLAEVGGEVNTKGISDHLAIKMPTVTSMMKKLATKGYIRYQSYKPVTLTQKGEKAAALIIRKHRLTEMYLVDKMGFGWEEVHAIAEQVEHVHSPEFFNKMDEILGHPGVDPHGSPIPDKQGRITDRKLRRLSDCKEGELFELSAVVHSGDDFLNFLNKRKLSLGIQMKILAIEPFDYSIKVMYNGHTDVFSQQVCERLLGE